MPLLLSAFPFFCLFKVSLCNFKEIWENFLLPCFCLLRAIFFFFSRKQKKFHYFHNNYSCVRKRTLIFLSSESWLLIGHWQLLIMSYNGFSRQNLSITNQKTEKWMKNLIMDTALYKCLNLLLQQKLSSVCLLFVINWCFKYFIDN